MYNPVVMANIRLIASDLDGTLLQNGAQKLNEETCGLIQNLKDCGIRFMASSGRQFDNLCRLFEPVKEDIYYLCQNGASAYADGSVLFQRLIDEELSRRLITDIVSRPELEVLVSGFACSFVEEKSEALYRHMSDVVRTKTIRTGDILSTVSGCTKISFFEENGLHDTAYWYRTYGERLSIAVGGPQWLDMTDRGVNKGTAFVHMLEYLQIDPAETMVFGDNLNDLEILDAAGVAVSVAGGAQPVKQRADLVTDTVEQVIREILAGRRKTEDWKK